MNGLDQRETVSRRDFLAASGTTALGAAMVVGAGTLVVPSQGWGMEVKALKPETMATLIQMARDIYPHDRIADKYYAKAMKQHDEAAAGDADTRAMLEDGVADLNASRVKGFFKPFAARSWLVFITKRRSGRSLAMRALPLTRADISSAALTTLTGYRGGSNDECTL